MAIEMRAAIAEMRAIAASAPLPVWAARATGLLLPQGLVVFLIHVVTGFSADHTSFPLGMRLDPVHSVVHVFWGAAGAYVGFLRPRWAVPYLLVFGVYYIALSILGTFTGYHFGMKLGWRENTVHWILGPAGLLIGLYGLKRGEPGP